MKKKNSVRKSCAQTLLEEFQGPAICLLLERQNEISLSIC